MAIRWNRLNRLAHHWGAIVCALPILVVLVSGLLLLLKKEVDWIQPPTQKSQGGIPTLDYTQLLSVVQSVPEAEIRSWDDVDRLDVRPSKGLIKVRADNGWEIQLHHQTGAIQQVAYRRTDLIESLHDGSFFHDSAKLWVFLPASVILTLLWITGMYLFALPYLSRAKKQRRKQERRKHQHLQQEPLKQEPGKAEQVAAGESQTSRA